jgi:hypothetical protein
MHADACERQVWVHTSVKAVAGHANTSCCCANTSWLLCEHKSVGCAHTRWLVVRIQVDWLCEHKSEAERTEHYVLSIQVRRDCGRHEEL